MLKWKCFCMLINFKGTFLNIGKMVWLQQYEILEVKSFRCNIHFELFRYYIFNILLLYPRPSILKKCNFHKAVHKNVLLIKTVPPLHSSGRYLYYSCCRKMPPLISQVRQTLTGILSIIKKQRVEPLKLMRKDMRIFHFFKFSDKMSNCSQNI